MWGDCGISAKSGQDVRLTEQYIEMKYSASQWMDNCDVMGLFAVESLGLTETCPDSKFHVYSVIELCEFNKKNKTHG